MATNSVAPASPDAGSRWCRSRSKRCMDLVIAALSLVLLSPVLLVIASAIRLASGKPIFFRQWRYGRYGWEFQLLKFRTMTAAENGPGLTRNGDSRVTRTGQWLRRFKLDELPQLVNVLKGEMTLVGPRPDLGEFWSRATVADQRVLAFKPGLTGAASVAFHDEERLLAQVPPELVTSFYLEHVLPRKATIDSNYAANATFWSDCGILLRTLLVSLGIGKESMNEFPGSEESVSSVSVNIPAVPGVNDKIGLALATGLDRNRGDRSFNTPGI